jgi:hypothetical protein
MAPTRIVVTDGNLIAAIASLGTGRWWPDMDRLLDGIDRQVPDRAGLAVERASDSELVIP